MAAPGRYSRVETPLGAFDLLHGETLVSVEPATAVAPAALPDATAELMRLTGARSVADIGRTRPAVASLSTAGGTDGDPFRLYEAVYGRDSQIIAHSVRREHPALLRLTLRFLAERQGLPRDRAPKPREYDMREEEAGRIPHEVRDPRVDPVAREITRKDGYGWPFYRSDDATLLFIRNVVEVAEADPSFLDEPLRQRDGVKRTMGDALVAALRWAEQRSATPEGLIESRRPLPRPGLRWLPAYPVWQDSGDAAFRPDGTLCTGSLATAELQAQFYDGLSGLARLAAADPARARRLGLDAGDLRLRAARVRASVLEHLWVPDRHGGYFAFAAERVGSRLQAVPVLKSNAGHLLDSAILDDPACARQVQGLVRSMFDPAYGLISTSGVRTCSSREIRFHPGAYHNGNVWAWENHAFAEGLRRHGFEKLAAHLDRTLVDNCATLRRYPEYISGTNGAKPEENRVVLWTKAHDPVLGTWNNPYLQPGQPVQGWTVGAFLDAQRQLKRTMPSAPAIRGLEGRLLGGLEALSSAGAEMVA
jgi:glycogen debranching enzyme